MKEAMKMKVKSNNGIVCSENDMHSSWFCILNLITHSAKDSCK